MCILSDSSVGICSITCPHLFVAFISDNNRRKETEQVFFLASQQSVVSLSLTLSTQTCTNACTRWRLTGRQQTEERERGADLGEGKGVVVRDENTGRRGRAGHGNSLTSCY